MARPDKPEPLEPAVPCAFARGVYLVRRCELRAVGVCRRCQRAACATHLRWRKADAAAGALEPLEYACLECATESAGMLGGAAAGGLDDLEDDDADEPAGAAAGLLAADSAAAVFSEEDFAAFDALAEIDRDSVNHDS